MCRRSWLCRHRLNHDLRHTHASLLLQAGVPVKVVSERLGHASPGFTLNVSSFFTDAENVAYGLEVRRVSAP